MKMEDLIRYVSILEEKCKRLEEEIDILKREEYPTKKEMECENCNECTTMMEITEYICPICYH